MTTAKWGWDSYRRFTAGLTTHPRLGWDLARRQSEQIVFSGTVSGLRVSSVDGTAFIDNAGATIPTYADGNHIIEIYNVGTGIKISGYLKAAGSAEGLGDELMADPTFDVTGSWMKGGATWTVSGGKANAANALAGEWVYQEKTLTLGTLYKGVGTCDSLTSGTFLLGVDNIIIGTAFNTTGAKTQYLTVSTGGATRVCGIRPATNLTGTFTDLSFKPVQTPSTSGATIVNSKGGTVYSFLSVDASFTYNAASYYVIVKLAR
jgi:hypothetical protein